MVAYRVVAVPVVCSQALRWGRHENAADQKGRCCLCEPRILGCCQLHLSAVCCCCASLPMQMQVLCGLGDCAGIHCAVRVLLGSSCAAMRM